MTSIFNGDNPLSLLRVVLFRLCIYYGMIFKLFNDNPKRIKLFKYCWRTFNLHRGQRSKQTHKMWKIQYLYHLQFLRFTHLVVQKILQGRDNICSIFQNNLNLLHVDTCIRLFRKLIYLQTVTQKAGRTFWRVVLQYRLKYMFTN